MRRELRRLTAVRSSAARPRRRTSRRCCRARAQHGRLVSPCAGAVRPDRRRAAAGAALSGPSRNAPSAGSAGPLRTMVACRGGHPSARAGAARRRGQGPRAHGRVPPPAGVVARPAPPRARSCTRRPRRSRLGPNTAISAARPSVSPRTPASTMIGVACRHRPAARGVRGRRRVHGRRARRELGATIAPRERLRAAPCHDAVHRPGDGARRRAARAGAGTPHARTARAGSSSPWAPLGVAAILSPCSAERPAADRARARRRRRQGGGEGRCASCATGTQDLPRGRLRGHRRRRGGGSRAGAPLRRPEPPQDRRRRPERARLGR